MLPIESQPANARQFDKHFHVLKIIMAMSTQFTISRELGDHTILVTTEITFSAIILP